MAVVLIVIKLFIGISNKLDLDDKPNQRSSHNGVIPRVGGLSIFIPYLLLGLGLYVLGFEFVMNNPPYWFGLTAIVVLGFVDDRVNLTSRTKFIFQFAVAILYVLWSGNYVDSMYGLLGIYELPNWFGTILSIIAVVYIINAVNLIDGIDGIAAGTSLLSLFLFSRLLESHEFYFTFWFIGVGLVMFTLFNFSKKNKIFLGDSGSLSLGFILATMAMELLHSGNMHHEKLNLNPLLTAVLILGYPIADTFRVFILRIAAGTNPFKPDRRHLHHVLLDKGFSHLGATMFIMLSVGIIVFINKGLAPVVDSHILIILNAGILLYVSLLMRYRSRMIRFYWRVIYRYTILPLKRIHTKIF